MRVLQAMAGAAVGGAENFFTRLVCALARRGLAQRALIRPDAAREATLLAAGVAIDTARFGGLLDFATGRVFRRAIDAFRPDIVVSWMNRATAFCPAPAGDRRFVHLGTPRGYYDPKYYRRCDHLVVATDDLARFYHRAGWPADRVTAIPNFAPDESATPVRRSSLDTPDGAPLLLALGRLHENKGFDTLLRALALLPEHYLWLAGDGPLGDSLRQIAAAAGVAGRVRFLGWRRDTAALYAACDAFVCPSRHEPFGNIIVEAWAQRAPVIAARREGPGTLIEDGASGLLVPVDDADALAAAIRRLAAEPGLADYVAAGGRAAYERDFTEDVVVRRYLDLFARLAG
jgi:glycosyltransferase involved in cell wall biosynthesis